MIQFDSFFFWNFLIHKTLELKYRLPKTNLAVFPLQMNQILIPEQHNPVASNDFNGTKVLTPHPQRRLIMEIWLKASEFKEESKTCITGLVFFDVHL